MQAEASPEHQWLMQLVGEWEYEHEAPCGPEGEMGKSTGREVYRALGDLWVVGELTGEIPGGGSMTCITTLGYDSARGRFVGNWVGSPMTHMFVYDGERDESGNILTLNCTGPSFEDVTKMAEYQDIIEMRGRDERLFRSRYKDDAGSWQQFMEGVFRRVK